jgi:hypothetical protein
MLKQDADDWWYLYIFQDGQWSRDAEENPACWKTLESAVDMAEWVINP